MIKNYFIIAWRNIKSNKLFSFINVFGLAIGLTCCLLITLYIYHETSYDSYHKNANQLYELATVFVKDGKEDPKPNTPAPMAAAMKQEYPEIADFTRIVALFAEDKTLLQYQPENATPRSFYETKGYAADSTFFRLFTYNFIEGNPNTCLNAPNTVVLNEEIAKKLFGNEPAINKTIRISSNSNGDTTFTVTGVFRPFNKPTQIDARFFISMKGGGIESFVNTQTDMAGNNMFNTFFSLKQGADASALESKFPAFVEKYIGENLKAMGFYKKQFLIPVQDMHLHSGMDINISPVGSMTSLYVLGSIALFTLLLACINFMNLSTARSSKRSAEVGIRKVLGAERKSLIKQFIGESVLMSCIALAFALLITFLSLKAFSYISGAELSLDFSSHWQLLLGFFIVAIITGLIAGSYPAFYLSSFRPIKVLKGKISNSLSAVALRKGLVVFQFVISVVLIIASVVINKQMKYMRTKDLGFAKDQQLIIPLRSSNAKQIYTPLKDAIKKNPLIEQVGATLYYPGIANPSDIALRREGKTVNDAKLVHTNVIDESLLQTLSIEPIAGRLFSEQFPADTNSRIIINTGAVKEIGFSSPQEAVGSKVFFDWRGESYEYTIVGVVKDFHFQDLRVPIAPYGFFLNNRPNYNYLIVHAKSGNISALLNQISKTWSSLNPNEPFEYSFLDEDFQKNYETENRQAAMVKSFTIIAILISCLGLFGLAMFSAEQRTKEIGIRKVLGASVTNLMGLLSKDFLKLVIIAFMIAAPFAWYFMNKWLQDFAYRINISWWVFAMAGLFAVVIAFVTISFQALRAATSNPVKN
ncbi:MAG TPA: ABC transporter permease, partial [Chitinophagaceae bacterium]|nr:ABC transporter permease [Chitinophagaceae bacterium]